MSIPDAAAAWMERIAADETHGYDQNHRWGPDYDCSSLVISAYRHAGVPLGSSYTGNMRADFLAHGFRDVTASVDLATGAGLRRGDVLLNERYHAAMYVGNGELIHARSNELGTAVGGQSGDQTGGEICEQPYYNYPWDCVLRYEGGAAGSYTVRPGDTLWAIAARFGTTVSALAKLNNLTNPDLIYPGQVLLLPGSAGSAQRTYAVRPGDTLWDIAARELGAPWRWREIYALSGLHSTTIYPGQILRLPEK